MSAGSFLRSLKDRYPNKLLYFPPSYHTDVRIRTAHPEPERQTDFRVAEPSLLEEEQTIVRRRCLFSNGVQELHFLHPSSARSFRHPDSGSGQTRRGSVTAHRLPHRYDARQ